MMNREWLSLTVEEAIEPELEIVDPHHHLWDYVSHYGQYEVADLQLDTDAGHNVVETVFIDCRSNYRTDGPEHLYPVGETEWTLERCRESEANPGARIAAIVSHVDLRLGTAAREVLEAHIEAADGRFRGIRHIGARVDDPLVPPSSSSPPAGLYGQADFREGAATLASMGLSFEAWQYHTQLGDVLELAKATPELSIIVNHVGGPVGIGSYADKRDEVWAETRAGLAALAELDNVVLKVGGIGMTRFGLGYENRERPPTSDELVADWGAELRHHIELFGPDRCMFESNFPVDGESCSYVVLWNAFKKLSADYSPTERQALFAGTARRIYKL